MTSPDFWSWLGEVFDRELGTDTGLANAVLTVVCAVMGFKKLRKVELSWRAARDLSALTFGFVLALLACMGLASFAGLP